MSSNPNAISEQSAIDKILAELLDKHLIASLQRDQLAKAIDGQTINEQDWRLLAELALAAEEQQHGRAA